MTGQKHTPKPTCLYAPRAVHLISMALTLLLLLSTCYVLVAKDLSLDDAITVAGITLIASFALLRFGVLRD